MPGEQGLLPKVGYINSIGLVSERRRRRVAAFRLHRVYLCMYVCMPACAHICIARGVAQTALFNNNEPHKHTQREKGKERKRERERTPKLVPVPGAFSMLHLHAVPAPCFVANGVNAAQVEANLHQTANSARIGQGTCYTVREREREWETNMSIHGWNCIPAYNSCASHEI